MKNKSYKIWYAVAGVFLILAIFSYLYSMYKDISAGNKSEELMLEFNKILEENTKEKTEQNTENTENTNDIAQDKNTDEINDKDEQVPEENKPQEEKHTNVAEVYDILGKISVPALSINLPILKDYSDELLNAAPCRYFGPDIGEDGHLVILGHNYKRHFGKLTIVKIGTEVILTDLDGNEYFYEVYETEVVKPEQTEALKKYEGKKGLTLITCTDFEGKERTLVRCREKNK